MASTDVTLALGFMPEPFVEAFPDGRCGGVALDYAVEPEPLDTAGAIRFAARHAGIDETFVVANGDVLTDLDVAALVDIHRDADAEATIHLIPVDDPSAFGVVELDDDGRVARFVEKPAPGTEPSNLINAGTYVFEPSVLDRIPPGGGLDRARDVPARSPPAGAPRAATDDYWIDAGRPDALPAGQPRPHHRGARPETAPASRRAPRSRRRRPVDDSVVGAGATVGDGATVAHSVLLPGADVGAGAVVERLDRGWRRSAEAPRQSRRGRRRRQDCRP